jgi:hypothetical protein
MKNVLLRSLLIGATCIAPIAAMAGGVEVETCCKPPRVDIPDMIPGWGISLEGSALRGYNNNLNYEQLVLSTSETVGFNTFTFTDLLFEDVDPTYAFGLRVGVSYTLANAGNVLKLFYEHLFDRSSTDSVSALIPIGTTEVSAVEAEGSVRQKLDGVSLLSEQHILIGPYWETTLSGGARFAHVSQQLNAEELVYTTTVASHSFVSAVAESASYSMQFNGVGPLAGLGTMFHVCENFLIGAEAQGALLMGRNKVGFNADGLTIQAPDPFLALSGDVDSIYSIVPEMYYRIYGNYFYRFHDGSELQVELGWRANQFFNLRTFTQLGDFNGVAVDITNSDDIGFSGPYLMFQYNI